MECVFKQLKLQEENEMDIGWKEGKERTLMMDNNRFCFVLCSLLHLYAQNLNN